jgi:hypothetical protein
MSVGTIRRWAGIAMLVGLVWGCGGAAGSAPASPSTASVPSTAASASGPAEPSVGPSVAPPSTAPSEAIPSFVLTSEAKDLEGLLPDKMCGATSTKTSQSGQSFAGDEDFAKVLSALGKSPADVAYAIAFGADSGCAAGIFRIQGVDTGALQAAFAAQAQKSGDRYTDKNVGGKDVKVQTSGSTTSYFYFKGDAVLFVTAETEAQAASVLQQLP